jgi:hypothetical protein
MITIHFRCYKSAIYSAIIHDRSLSCLGTGISIKSGGVKLVNLSLVRSLKKTTNNLKVFESAIYSAIMHNSHLS